MQVLPVEIISSILSKLSIYDLIKNARLVNKNIKSIVDHNVKVKSLIVSLDQDICQGKWSYIDEPFDLNDSIKVKNLDFLLSEPTRLIFSRMRRLCIYAFPNEKSSYDLNDLNFFRFLEHLELRLLEVEKLTELSLSNLKILTLNGVVGNILVNTNLCHFESFEFFKDQFTYDRYQSIRSINCPRFDPLMKTLINLEHLSTGFIDNIDEDFLRKLSNLKSILFEDSDLAYNELRKQKKMLNRKEVKIYFFGIDFEEDQMNEWSHLNFNKQHLTERNLKIYTDNYNKLYKAITFIWKLNYNSIENHFHHFDHIPNDFFTKFPSIINISISQPIADPDSFLKFLTRYNLISLNFKKTGLQQSHFENLSYICKSLNTLGIEENNIQNFDFVLNFENMIDLEIEHEIPVNLVQQAYKKLKYLESFYFVIANQMVGVFWCTCGIPEEELSNSTRRNNKSYEIEFGNKDNVKLKTLDNLQNFLE